MSDTILTQTGFLANYNSNFIPAEKHDDIKVMQSLKFGAPLIKRDKDFHYNIKITEVYHKLEEDERNINNFAFREEALNAVLNCFNTNSLFTWFTLQRQSKFLTLVHKRFLNDTFRFITTGNRSVSIETWIRLLDLRLINDKDSIVEYEVSDYFKTNGLNETIHLDCINFDDQYIPFATHAAISKWTSQPTGFKDLIIFCYVVFGKNEMLNVFNERYS